MISCSRHDTKAGSLMTGHARISHCQVHAHSGKKVSKRYREHANKSVSQGRAAAQFIVRSKGLGDASPTSKMDDSGCAEIVHFSHVCTTMPCLPGLREGERRASRENEVFAVWAPTCPACQDCAEAKDWQAGKRSFCMVCTTMPCLPGS